MYAKLIISVVVNIWLLSICVIAATTPVSMSMIHRDKQGVISVDITMKTSEVERTKDGIRITASGSLEDKIVGLALIIPDKWAVTPMHRTDGKVQRQFLPILVRVGEPSETLDAILRSLFKLKEAETIFKRDGYRGVTLETREQVERAEVRIGLGDHGIEGESYWRFDITLDLPNKSMKLNVRNERL